MSFSPWKASIRQGYAGDPDRYAPNSDGVKVSERWKTTEQVERAHVEDREHQFLYQDGDGFHFMNMDNYDQVAVTPRWSGIRPPICSRR